MNNILIHMFSSRIYTLTLLIISLFFSCTKTSHCDDIEYRKGKYYEVKTGELASGNYECEEESEMYKDVKHVRQYQYSKGLRQGKWTYHYNDDLIHYGEFLEESELTTQIKNYTQAEWIQIEVWKEGTYGYLNLYIASAGNTYSGSEIFKHFKNPILELCKYHQVKRVVVKRGVEGFWLDNSFEVEHLLNNESHS